MSPLSGLTGPGFLSVQSQPKPGFVDEFHEWYNSEHGPLRVRLDIFLNGYRYRSTEDPSIYLATYELKRISGLDEPSYISLNENRSSREQQILDHKLNFLDRRVYADVSSRGHVDGPPPVLMSVAYVVKDEHVDELHRWYEEEHIPDFMKIPGWLRTRRFKLVEGDGQPPGCTELLAVHEFAKVNGLGGEEHEFARLRPWRNRIQTLLESRKNQSFEFLHEFHADDYIPPREVNNGMPNGHLTNDTKASNTPVAPGALTALSP